MKSRIFIAALLVLGLWSNSSQAQMLQAIVDFGPPRSAPSGYSGPGDIVSGATAWWGLRAYNAAYATAGSKIANVCIPLDVSCSDVDATASGGLNPSTIVALGCNNTTVICTIKIYYDQSGGNACSGPCDMSQTTIANRFNLVVPGASNGCTNAADYCTSVSGNGYYQTPGLGSNIAQPITETGVAIRTADFTDVGQILFDNNPQFFFNNSANQIGMYNGSTVTATAADGAWHSGVTVFNAANSYLTIDAATPSPTSNGSSGLSSGDNLAIGARTGGGQNLTGGIVEAGIWPSAFSTANQTAMNSNMHTYWGF